mgnify:CR=1 FL=1|jgi:hypothetical protein
MNTLFKELAKEAGMYVDLKGEPWPKWMGAEECEQAYKKFAELIVEECMSNLHLHGYDDAMNQIKQHFGIEL